MARKKDQGVEYLKIRKGKGRYASHEASLTLILSQLLSDTKQSTLTEESGQAAVGFHPD